MHSMYIFALGAACHTVGGGGGGGLVGCPHPLTPMLGPHTHLTGRPAPNGGPLPKHQKHQGCGPARAVPPRVQWQAAGHGCGHHRQTTRDWSGRPLVRGRRYFGSGVQPVPPLKSRARHCIFSARFYLVRGFSLHAPENAAPRTTETPSLPNGYLAP